jgi:hypothetical protein
MAEGHCFKANGRPRLCRARLGRIRVDLAGSPTPSGNDRYLRIGAVRQIVSNGHQPFKDVADPKSSIAAGVGVDDDVRPAVRLAVEVRIHLAFSAAV